MLLYWTAMSPRPPSPEFRSSLPGSLVYSHHSQLLKSSFWMEHGNPPMPLETAASPSAYSSQCKRLSKNNSSANTQTKLCFAVIPNFSTAAFISLVMFSVSFSQACWIWAPQPGQPETFHSGISPGLKQLTPQIAQFSCCIVFNAYRVITGC